MWCPVGTGAFDLFMSTAYVRRDCSTQSTCIASDLLLRHVGPWLLLRSRSLAPSKMASRKLAVAEAMVKVTRLAAALAEAEMELTQLLEQESGQAQCSETRSPASTPVLSPSRASSPASQPAAAPPRGGGAVEPPPGPPVEPPPGITPHAKAMLSALHMALRAGGSSAGSSTTPADNAGEFAKFGDAMWVRAWLICGNRSPGWRCSTFTLSQGWTIDWSEGNSRQCCRSECHKKYRSGDVIVQLRLRDRDFFVRAETPVWEMRELEHKLRAPMSKRISDHILQTAMAELQPMRFEEVFRQATQEDVKPGVQWEKTFIVLDTVDHLHLPLWSWELIQALIRASA